MATNRCYQESSTPFQNSNDDFNAKQANISNVWGKFQTAVMLNSNKILGGIGTGSDIDTIELI